MGGPIALVEEGDMISIDIRQLTDCDVLVSDEELAAEKPRWRSHAPGDHRLSGALRLPCDQRGPWRGAGGKIELPRSVVGWESIQGARARNFRVSKRSGGYMRAN